MASNNFIKALKLAIPVIQAPMAGITTPRMVVAACNAGLAGSLAGGMMSPSDLSKAIKEIKSKVAQPFSVNVFIIDNLTGYTWADHDIDWLKDYCEQLGLSFASPYTFAPGFDEQFQVLLDTVPPIASFTFGILTKDQVKALHDKSIMVIGTATTLPEALAWEEVGADAICAQAIEAGGHRGSFLNSDTQSVGLFALIPEIVANTRLPVIAAGGIMNGQGIVAAQVLGASAVQMGTLFLTSKDTDIGLAYRQGLSGRKFAHDTTLTKAFTGKYARGLKNKFSEYGKDKYTLPYPVQNALTQPLREASNQRGDPENYSLWVGQGISFLQHNKTIKEIVETLSQEIKAVKEQLSDL